MSDFDLGKIRFEMKIDNNGRCILSINVVEDKLNEMFPIDTTKSLTLSKTKYKRYVNRILQDKEKWIRENISPGTYYKVINIVSEDLEFEEINTNRRLIENGK